jgi:hypothetical protein
MFEVFKYFLSLFRHPSDSEGVKFSKIVSVATGHFTHNCCARRSFPMLTERYRYQTLGELDAHWSKLLEKFRPLRQKVTLH